METLLASKYCDMQRHTMRIKQIIRRIEQINLDEIITMKTSLISKCCDTQRHALRVNQLIIRIGQLNLDEIRRRNLTATVKHILMHLTYNSSIQTVNMVADRVERLHRRLKEDRVTPDELNMVAYTNKKNKR